jgi:hypothetical protein
METKQFIDLFGVFVPRRLEVQGLEDFGLSARSSINSAIRRMNRIILMLKIYFFEL